MKKSIFNSIWIVSLFLLLSKGMIGQATDATNERGSTRFLGWDGSGIEPGSLEIRNDFEDDIEFWTDESFRAILTSIGRFGLNTATPSMMFHVNNGGILSTGTAGANPDLGAGTRLMWVPSQTAFRAGSVTGTQWDGGNVGSGSYSLGIDNTASGYISSALGYDNSVSGNFSQAFGLENEITGAASSAIGKMNIIDGAGSLSLGCFTQSSEDFGFILGTGVDGSNLLTNSIENSLYVGFNSDIPTLFVGPSAGVDDYGHVGVNTTSPEMLLHVEEGGLLATATAESPTTPDLGTGTRLIWMPDLGALRAGFVVTNEWDPINVGENSVAFGQSSIALGEASFAAGHYNNVSSETGMALGRFNVLEFTDPPQPGRAGIAAFAAGRANNVDGDSGMALGLNNLVQSQAGVALGELNEVSGVAAVAGGFRCESHGEGSIALGHEAIADADKCLAFGSTYNDIEESMLVGFSIIGDVLFAGPGASGGPVSGVGIGGIDEPTERLDVDGNARFRDMPSDAADVLVTGVEESGAGDYSLSTLAFTADDDEYLGGDGNWNCNWNTGSGNVFTGHTTTCNTGNVGIGSASPTSKLTVVNAPTTGTASVDVQSTGSGAIIHSGMRVRSSGGTTGIYGFQSSAVATANATGGGGNEIIYGVRGEGSSMPVSTDYTGYDAVYGIYGSTTGAASGTNYYAGYFAGDVFSTTGQYLGSDAMLKSNIEELSSTLDKVMALQPKTYEYNQDQFPHMNLPAGTHVGFIAGELSEVFPELVKGATQPAELDESGNVIHESVSFNGVNYTGLIPHLVSAIQEQQEAIAAQQAQIEALTALVQNCCTAGGDKSLQGSGSTSSPTELSDFDLRIEQAYLGQNVPNPFQNETSITYRIPAQAMVRVRILSQNGQQVDTLVDGLMPRGEYRIVWNASLLPAGLYFYTLEADGVELVKKAVKL